MKRLFQILAPALVASATLWWWAAGAHSGWTRTQVPVTVRDEVTGIEGIRYESGFVPGLDFLAAAGVLAGVLTGVSRLFRPPGASRSFHSHS